MMCTWREAKVLNPKSSSIKARVGYLARGRGAVHALHILVNQNHVKLGTLLQEW